MDEPGEKVSNSRSFTMIFLSSERGTAPKLGVRSDDRPPQTIRAFGLQELQPSPSLFRSERSRKTCRSFKTLSPGSSIPCSQKSVKHRDLKTFMPGTYIPLPYNIQPIKQTRLQAWFFGFSGYEIGCMFGVRNHPERMRQPRINRFE